MGLYRNGELRVGADGIGPAAPVADDRAQFLRVERLLAAGAPLAVAARAAMPADTDAPAELKVSHLCSGGGDGADHLVAGDERILRPAPVVVDHRKVTRAIDW